MRTKFTSIEAEAGESRTDSAQNTPESEIQTVKFPKVIRHRKAEVTIYGKKPKYPFYRLAYRINGRRLMKSFQMYGEAKTEAEKKVREIAEGSQVAALTAAQGRDAMAALERLDEFYKKTGHRVSLLKVASEYVDIHPRLNGHSLTSVVDGFTRTVANVKRKDIAEAFQEFLQTDAPRTKAIEGQRSQISAKYAYNREIHLDKFADTFPNTALCDLTKEHLDTFIESLGELSAKSRNNYRGTIRQILQWAVRKDYLPAAHRLNEADGMRSERANTSETLFSTPQEFETLLKNADEWLRPVLAIGGLAGLRTAELLRLDWSDVWRVPGHIEITAGNAKTRQRRLVEITPELAAWLEPFRSCKSGKVWTLHEITFHQKFGELCVDSNIARKGNGLRHAYCTYHFALLSNENETAKQAGNSPSMVHGHYKGLATKADAEKWFSVKPTKTLNGHSKKHITK